MPARPAFSADFIASQQASFEPLPPDAPPARPPHETSTPRVCTRCQEKSRDPCKPDPKSSIQGDAVLKANDTAGARSDTVNLKRPAVGIHALAAGSVKILDAKGPRIDALPHAGGTVSVVIVRVYDTGTTVANANLVLFFQE